MGNPGLDDPVAICVAPNGARRTRADHPAIPLTAGDLARTAAECLDAGACVFHLHVRRPDGTHLLDAGAYRAATEAIRHAVADRMIVQITSESVGLYGAPEQESVIRAVKPEAVSMALKEFVPEGGDPSAFAGLLSWMKRERILPQIILYSAQEALHLQALRQRGVLPWDDIPVLYVLGRYTANQTSKPADLLPFLAPDMPRFRRWCVCAFGREEAACVLTGALLGGDIRIGFENNLQRPDGVPARSNAEQVAAAAAGLASLHRARATAHDVRARHAAES